MGDTEVVQAAGEVLDSVERIRGGTRTRVRGAWFPLIVFGVITLASISLYNRPFAYPRGHRGFVFNGSASPYYAGLPGARSQLGAYLFWLLLAPLGYLTCAVWYRRRAQRLGVSFRWERWVVAGLGLFALLQAFLAMPVYEAGRVSGITNEAGATVITGESGHVSGAVGVQTGLAAFATPLFAVAVGLLVLAWIERNWVVAVVAVLFGGFTVVENTYGLGQIPSWMIPPRGFSKDYFVAPAHILVVLTLLLFAGAGLCAIRARFGAAAK